MKKSYYAIIPATVRYDENLCANAKLLYGELTALANEKGFCWASNSYFADLYNVHKNTISKWISQLKQAGYISIEIQNLNGNYDRKIYINDSPKLKDVGPLNEKVEGPKLKDVGPLNEKVNTPKRKAEHNITYNNTYNNTGPPREIINLKSKGQFNIFDTIQINLDSKIILMSKSGRLKMNDLIYEVKNEKVQLKQKQDNNNIYIDFSKNLIFIKGRAFDNIESYLNNQYNDTKIKNEIYLLNELYQKNKNANQLSISVENIKNLKEKQKEKAS